MYSRLNNFTPSTTVSDLIVLEGPVGAETRTHMLHDLAAYNNLEPRVEGVLTARGVPVPDWYS
jgi:hypothetical protein